MKKSMFRWFFVAIFCLTFSAGVQASFLDDLKAGKITVEEAIAKAKALGIPLGDIVRLVVAFSPSKTKIGDIVKVAVKGESASAVRTIVVAAIGTLITGSGVGAIKDKDILETIVEITTAVKEGNSGASDTASEVAKESEDSGVANAGGDTATTDTSTSPS